MTYPRSHSELMAGSEVKPVFPNKCPKQRQQKKESPSLPLIFRVQPKNKFWRLPPQHIPSLAASLHCPGRPWPSHREPVPACHGLPAGLHGCHPSPPCTQLLSASREMLLKCKSDPIASRLKTLQGSSLYLKPNPTPYRASSAGTALSDLTLSCSPAQRCCSGHSGLLLSSPRGRNCPACRPLNLGLSSARITLSRTLPQLPPSFSAIEVKRPRRCPPQPPPSKCCLSLSSTFSLYEHIRTIL